MMFPAAPLIAATALLLSRLAPCPPEGPRGPSGDPDVPDMCEHSLAGFVTVVVAGSADDVALLAGLAAHETGFRTRHQHGGPARSWWQLEVPRAERAVVTDDPYEAGRRALVVARGCPSLRSYAFGRCRAGSRAQEAVAAALRACVGAAGTGRRCGVGIRGTRDRPNGARTRRVSRGAR